MNGTSFHFTTQVEKGVIDREVAPDFVVVISEQQEWLLPKKLLPANTQEGTWILLEVKHDDIVNVKIDEKTTEKQRIKGEWLREKIKSSLRVNS